MIMQSKFIQNNITYTGKELRAAWIREHTHLEGNAIVAFVGPADVPIENMVDLEDIAENAPIYSPLMLHFLAEHFEQNMELAVCRQRLLVVLACEELERNGVKTQRSGDDIFVNAKKLSVSIAAPARASTCIHFALNIETAGTPVPTSGLNELNIIPQDFAQKTLVRKLHK